MSRRVGSIGKTTSRPASKIKRLLDRPRQVRDRLVHQVEERPADERGNSFQASGDVGSARRDSGVVQSSTRPVRDPLKTRSISAGDLSAYDRRTREPSSCDFTDQYLTTGTCESTSPSGLGVLAEKRVGEVGDLRRTSSAV